MKKKLNSLTDGFLDAIAEVLYWIIYGAAEVFCVIEGTTGIFKHTYAAIWAILHPKQAWYIYNLRVHAYQRFAWEYGDEEYGRDMQCRYCEGKTSGTLILPVAYPEIARCSSPKAHQLRWTGLVEYVWSTFGQVCCYECRPAVKKVNNMDKIKILQLYSTNIAVVGMSADPMHLGQLKLIEYLRNLNEFDAIWLVPCGERTKNGRALTPAKHRRKIIELTIPQEWFEDDSIVIVDWDEMERENTPTIQYLETLQKKFPHTTLYFCLGSDLLEPKPEYSSKCEIEAKWINGPELMETAMFGIFQRKGSKDFASYQSKLPDDRYRLFNEADLPEISSTRIRELAEAGKYAELRKIDWLTDEVVNFLESEKVYEK